MCFIEEENIIQELHYFTVLHKLINKAMNYS